MTVWFHPDITRPYVDEARLLKENRFVANLLVHIDSAEAGADFTEPEPGAKRTPEQMWGSLLRTDPGQRRILMEMIIRLADVNHNCFLQNHAGRIEQLTAEIASQAEYIGRLEAEFEEI